MLVEDIRIDRDHLAELCQHYGIVRLEVFGSFPRGDAGPGSDLDVLVSFAPGVRHGLEMVTLQQELEALFGRSVDVLTRRSVERSPNKYFRRFALRDVEPLYERS